MIQARRMGVPKKRNINTSDMHNFFRFSRARFDSRTPALVSCQQHAVFLIFPLFLGNEKKRRKKSPKVP